jgi:hypothetical protein
MKNILTCWNIRFDRWFEGNSGLKGGLDAAELFRWNDTTKNLVMNIEQLYNKYEGCESSHK